MDDEGYSASDFYWQVFGGACGISLYLALLFICPRLDRFRAERQERQRFVVEKKASLSDKISSHFSVAR